MSDYKVIFLNDLAIALRSDAELTVVNLYLRYFSTISSDNSDESRSIMDYEFLSKSTINAYTSIDMRWDLKAEKSDEEETLNPF